MPASDLTASGMAMQMLLVYLVSGVIFALVVIGWALKNRQFSEQERAKFLPLLDIPQEAWRHEPARRVPASVKAIALVLVAGLGPVIAMLVMVFQS